MLKRRGQTAQTGLRTGSMLDRGRLVARLRDNRPAAKRLASEELGVERGALGSGWSRLEEPRVTQLDPAGRIATIHSATGGPRSVRRRR